MAVLTYQPSGGDTVIPGSQGVGEWSTLVGGVVAACGEAALAAALTVTTGSPATGAQVTSLTQNAVGQGWTVGKYAYAGQSSPQTLANLAKSQGVTLNDMSYQQALSQYAGVRPIVIGISNATALGGDDANVQGHYITVLGKTSGGNYVVSDPNQQASQSGGLVVYTPQQIADAQPFSAQVPSTGPSGNAGNTSGLLGGGAANAGSGGVLQGIAASFGVSSVQDLAWRTGFIVLGGVMVVVGTLILFRKEAGTVVALGAKAAVA